MVNEFGLPKQPAMISFSCPTCSKTYRVPSDKAGKSTKCPSCGTSLTVPVPKQEERGVRPVFAPTSQFTRSRSKRILLWSALASISMLLACGVVFSLRSTSSESATPEQTEELLTNAKGSIQRKALPEAAELLQSYLSSTNAGRREQAYRLLEELELATSSKRAEMVMQGLPDAQVTGFCDELSLQFGFVILNPGTFDTTAKDQELRKVLDPSLKEVYRQTLETQALRELECRGVRLLLEVNAAVLDHDVPRALKLLRKYLSVLRPTQKARAERLLAQLGALPSEQTIAAVLRNEPDLVVGGIAFEGERTIFGYNYNDKLAVINKLISEAWLNYDKFFHICLEERLRRVAKREKARRDDRAKRGEPVPPEQVSDNDKKAVRKVMTNATAMLEAKQQQALKDIEVKGGFSIGNDKLSAIMPEEFASVFKAMGLLSGSTKQPAYLTIGEQMIVTEGEGRAAIIRGYFLIEQATLLSRKQGFRFQVYYSGADRMTILANLDKCGDELLFAGLPYAERASSIQKRLLVQLDGNLPNVPGPVPIRPDAHVDGEKEIEPLVTINTPAEFQNAVDSGHVEFSHDGGTLVANLWRTTDSDGRPPAAPGYLGGKPGYIMAYEPRTGKQLRRIRAHIADYVHAFWLSPDGKRITSSCHFDPLLKTWDLSSGKLLKTLSKTKYGVTNLTYSPDGKLLVCAKQKLILVLDATTGKERLEPLECESQVSSLVFSQDVTRLAATGEGGKSKAWDLTTGKVALVVNKNKRDMEETVLSFSPDGKLLALTGSYHDEDREAWIGEIRLVDMADGSDFKRLIGHASPKAARNNPLSFALSSTSTVSSAKFSPDGKYLVSSGYDKTVRVWNTATGEQVRVIKSHTDRVRSIAFSPDAKLMASCGASIKVWDWAKMFE